MTDAVETLARQIAEWETEVQAARNTLRIGEAILPRLRETLADLTKDTSPAAPQSAVAAPPATTLVAKGPALQQIRGAEEVQVLVGALALEQVAETFDQRDVAAALEAQGYTVNRSTLGQNLLMMAKAGEGIAIHTPGRGRKGTIFRKLPKT